MDELVKLVAEKLGLSESIAQQAVTLILDQLKQHLPAPIAGQIDKLIDGSAGLSELGNVDLGNLDKGSDLLGKLGGLFGKK